MMNGKMAGEGFNFVPLCDRNNVICSAIIASVPVDNNDDKSYSDNNFSEIELFHSL